MVILLKKMLKKVHFVTLLLLSVAEFYFTATSLCDVI